MNCAIVTIGDELLIGQVVDTNSAYMAHALNRIGVDVGEIVSVRDDPRQITSTLQRLASEVPLILITGGLGPTRDDMTKTTLAAYWEDELVLHEPSYRQLEQFIKARHLEMNPLNERQAWLPSRCEALTNACGSAPGMWYAYRGTVYVSMPGVPSEMRTMMTDQVLPRIAARMMTDQVVHYTLVVSGISESNLAIRLEAWETALPDYIKLAYLPDAGVIRLRLTARGPQGQPLEDELRRHAAVLRPLLGQHLLGENVESIEEIIGQQLLEQHATLATAESCTGGNIARRITSVPGCSRYFSGSVVAYSNRVKTEVLHVSPETIASRGAVSRETVAEMVMGVRRLLHADYAIAVSGIAGPGGGMPDKPVGTVWIAVASPVMADARCFMYTYERDRQQVINRATHAALMMLSDLLQKR